MEKDIPYTADRSLVGKLRRRFSRMIYTKPAQLQGLKRPLLTISFDDAPASSATNGAEILARYGLKGTWFISAGVMDHDCLHLGRYASAQEVKAVAAAGHEIACHTYSHLDCGQASGADIAQNIEQNQTALREMGVAPSTTFAYPYGDVSPQAKVILNDRYLAARALHHGLITTGTDLNQAPAVGIEGADGEAVALDWMRKAEAAHDAWLVLYTHDVRENPSGWGCTPEALDRLMGQAIEMGFEIVTFAEGARLALGDAAAKAA